MSILNFDFDIAAILLYLIVIYSYLQKQHVTNSQHKIFVALFVCAVLTPIFDIPASLLIESQAHPFWVMLTNTIYYISKQGTTFCFLMYIFSQFQSQRILPRKQRAITLAPLVIIVILILINPLTGWIFDYKFVEDQGFTYIRGPLRVITFIACILYFIWTCKFVHDRKHLYNKSIRKLVYAISTINILAQLIQYFNSSILLHSIAFAISMLLMILNLERYGMVVDPVSGMAKKEHLELLARRNSYSRIPFYSVMIKIAGYDALTASYGLETTEAFIRELEKTMVSFSGQGKGFLINTNFFVLLFDYKSNIFRIQEQLYENLKKPRTINNVELSCEFFITCICYPDHVRNMESYLASIQGFEKHEGTNYGVIPAKELKINDSIREQKVKRAIEYALQNDKFQLFYQPICTSDEKKFVTAEALIRLNDMELGRIPPDEFIPIAEKSGLIIQIGNWVLETVCKFIHDHDMEKLGLEYIEVNLSTVQVLQRNFIETIDAITAKYGVESRYLCFEITETASNAAPAIFAENLDLLNQRNYILALDDFGTGYGNLQRMVTHNFKIIKFDKNMTQKLSQEGQLQKVYQTLQKMITSMGSSIVTEGVETQEQYDFIKNTGAGYIQGFFFSKPLSENDFVRFLEQNAKTNSNGTN
ncbi:MAG: EAL domain-containing protein [Treponema sp.]|nr:EAL domain-containing protein [Candidatus Treponema equifaecale]